MKRFQREALMKMQMMQHPSFLYCGKERTQRWLFPWSPLKSEEMPSLYTTVSCDHSGLTSGLQASVILFGERDAVRRNSLSKVNFDSYRAIVSCVNIDNTHWKLLYISVAESRVYLVDPARNCNELTQSEYAANRLREYLKMRRACHSKTDWVDVQWKGAIMQHPAQQDNCSCGVIVMMMAKLVMEAFPQIPTMAFGTTKKDMARERKNLALEILRASVFNADTTCTMCSATKPPGPGPSLTDWIQCDNCCRWFHAQCLQMDTTQLEKSKKEDWNCCLCGK
ncbi:hypothetical protein Q5P01_013112 [Channa striata]|uniref:PHD-type domain-containing protein n=1 Tax=Channa striata TaxID=64152 RepID=A0AA88MIT7_CHASR|nr:hypothetical protein Q5P01_013112 [Channa striata]